MREKLQTTTVISENVYVNPSSPNSLAGMDSIVRLPGALKAMVPAHEYSKAEAPDLRMSGWNH